jgi:chemotaxis signal transduction protein
MDSTVDATPKMADSVPGSQEPCGDSGPVLSFGVGSFLLTVPAVSVLAIIEPATVHGLPLTGNGIMGVMNYRRQVAKVVSLRKKFGLEDRAEPRSGQLILSQLSVGLTAFWVDQVHDILSPEDMEPGNPPALSIFTVFSKCLLKGDQIFLATDFETLFALAPPPDPEPTTASGLSYAASQPSGFKTVPSECSRRRLKRRSGMGTKAKRIKRLSLLRRRWMSWRSTIRLNPWGLPPEKRWRASPVQHRKACRRPAHRPGD